MVIQRRIARRERRGKPPIHGWIHQLRGLRKQQLSDVMQSESRFLHCVRHCHCLEVSTMVYFARLAVEERVVRCYTPFNNVGNETEGK